MRCSQRVVLQVLSALDPCGASSSGHQRQSHPFLRTLTAHVTSDLLDGFIMPEQLPHSVVGLHRLNAAARSLFLAAPSSIGTLLLIKRRRARLPSGSCPGTIDCRGIVHVAGEGRSPLAMGVREGFHQKIISRQFTVSCNQSRNTDQDPRLVPRSSRSDAVVERRRRRRCSG